MFKPRFTITSSILNRLSEIAEIRAIVDRSRLLPTREAMLRRSSVIKMAHSSTSIEGNTLNEPQVKAVFEGKFVRAEPKEITEVKNYLLALKEVDKISKSKSNFNSSDILKLHTLVMSGGHFRPGPVYVVNVRRDGSEQLTYTPPPHSHVPPLVENLITWVDSSTSLHPIIRAGLLHYQFESIHPFADGNGRVGRLLTLLHLYQSGWDFRRVLVLEEYYNANRKGYYTALQTAPSYTSRKNVDLTNWLEYFTMGFWEEAQKVKNQVISLQTIGTLETTENFLSNDELKIVDFTLTVGKITSSDVMDILHVPKRTAQLRLNRLMNSKVLQKQGAGPTTFYIISP